MRATPPYVPKRHRRLRAGKTLEEILLVLQCLALVRAMAPSELLSVLVGALASAALPLVEARQETTTDAAGRVALSDSTVSARVALLADSKTARTAVVP